MKETESEKRRLDELLAEYLADAKKRGLHAGAILGISDCVAEEVLLLEKEREGS